MYNRNMFPLDSIIYSWFQTFAVFWMLYDFFWFIPRHLNFVCQCFGTLCLFHLHRRVGTKNDWVENVRVFIQEKVWLRAKPFPGWNLERYLPCHSSYLPVYEDGKDSVFRNVGIYSSEENIQHNCSRLLLYKGQQTLQKSRGSRC